MASVPLAAEQAHEVPELCTGAVVRTPQIAAEPVLGESPQSPPDSSPSLRALEVSRVPVSFEPAEPSDEAELDEFGADRTPAAILIDRAAIARPRSKRQRALPLASAVTVAVLGSMLWWQAVRMRTGTAVPVSESTAVAAVPNAREREPEREPELEPKPVAPEADSVPAPTPQLGAVASPEVAYDAQRLDFALRWARTHADRCHRGGRAVGTAQLSITFSPAGKVTAFQLTGEPIASAPVARCVATYFQSMRIPAFDGDAFTIHETLTLR